MSKPKARSAINKITVLKQERQNLSSLPIVQAWDREAYFPTTLSTPNLGLPRVTPGLALFAFSRLLQHIYGISLQPAEVHSGEIWHSDVRKVAVVDEVEGIIGWIYFDLYSRSGKGDGAVHYTVRCSRRTDDDDDAGDFLPGDEGRELTAELEDRFVLSSEAHTSNGRPGGHQRPVAVVSCGFEGSGRGKDPQPARLHWPEVATLWHEMGHAMHCG